MANFVQMEYFQLLSVERCTIPLLLDVHMK